MTEDRKVKVGVIGTGAIARVAHFPVLTAMTDVELTAVYSGHYENARAAAERYGVKQACERLEDFLDAGLDCAFLLTPKTVRSEYLLPLMDRGLDIFCEKPLSTSLPECAAIADAAARSGNIVMVGFNRRFAPCNRKMIAAFGDRKPQVVNAVKTRSTWWTCCGICWASAAR